MSIPSRRFQLVCAVLLAASAALRIAVLVSSSDWIVFRQPALDAAFYHESAMGILAGTWPGGEPYFMGPLYSYVLAALYQLTGPDVLAARVLHLVLGVSALALVAVLARRLAGDVAAYAALVIGGLYGPLIFYEQLLLIATLLTALAVLLLERTLAFTDRGGLRAAIALGLAFGACVALRGSALLYALPIVWCARRRLVSREGALALGCAALVILPFTVHNLRSGSHAVLTTNLGWNLFIGNHGGARGMFAYPNGWRAETDPTGRAFASRLAGEALDADATNAFWLEQTRAAVARDVPGAFRRAARKLMVFLQAAEIPQNESYAFFLANVPPARAAVLGWWVLLPLALLGAVVRRPASGAGASRIRSTTLLFALVPLLTCAVFFVTGRYRLPAVPFLLVLAGAGVAWLGDAASRRPRRALGALGLVLAASVGLLIAPAPFDVSRALARDHEHLGLRYQRAGAMRAAESEYRRALDADPTDGDALNNLGTVLMSQDRVAEAADAFERASRSQPGNPVPLQNLAAALGRLGDDAGAEEALRRAVRLDPQRSALWMNLGTALARQRRFAEAVTVYERALALEPGNAEIQDVLRTARDFRDAAGDSAGTR